MKEFWEWHRYFCHCGYKHKNGDVVFSAACEAFSPLALNIIEQFKLKDGLRLKEMGEVAGGFEYSAVNAAIARFEKRLKIDRDLQQKIKKVAKEFNIEI